MDNGIQLMSDIQALSGGGSGLGVGDIFAIILGLLLPIACFITFYVTRKMIEKQLRQNPPISEAQIRAMFMSMGRKPSEAQIRNTMNSMRNAKGNDYSKRK